MVTLPVSWQLKSHSEIEQTSAVGIAVGTSPDETTSVLKPSYSTSAVDSAHSVFFAPHLSFSSPPVPFLLPWPSASLPEMHTDTSISTPILYAGNSCKPASSHHT